MHKVMMLLVLVLVAVGCSESKPEAGAAAHTAEEVTVQTRDVELHPGLGEYIAERLGEMSVISDERKKALEAIAAYVRPKAAAGEPSQLTFICTHNSRRSHMSQLWAQTAAHYFSVPGVETFSGGTEATAFNPRAVAALRRAGFVVEQPAESANPIYEVTFGPEMEPMQAFSKVYSDPPNPQEGFAAVMTCSSADASCPIVFGAAERIAIPYDDPKEFDGTEREATAYDERCRQIAREMLYVFSAVAGG
jgi:hypothetical protein